MDLHMIQAYLLVPTIIIAVLLVSIATQFGPVYKRRRLDDIIFLGMWVCLFASILCDFTAVFLYAVNVGMKREIALFSTNLVMMLNLVFIYLCCS